MSGFEITGVVLGSIPLIISALEHYGDGIAVLKKMKQYECVFSDIQISFSASVGIYMDSCYQLLNPLNLPDQQMNDLLEERKREAWKSPQLRKDLEKRLGPNFKTYMLLLDKLNRKILLFCKKLKLNDDLKPPWVRPNGDIDEIARKKFFRNTWTKIRGGFDSKKYDTLLKNIDSDIDKISKLTAGAVQLEPLRAEKKNRLQSMYWKSIRDQAQRLFENLSSRLYSCPCQHLHKANLQLDVRKVYDIDEDTLRFAFLFTFEKSLCGPEDFPWDWRDVEIETSQCSNALATISSSPSSTFVIGGSTRFAPSITVSSSTSSQPIRHSPSPSLTLKIDNLCSRLMQSYNSKCCLGFLEDQPWQHHVYSVPGPGTSNQISEVASLKEVICVNKSSMATREKCALALTLASAVLQLHNTSWLPKTWDTKDIFMLKTRAGSSLPPHFYVSQTFGSTTTTSTIAKRRRCVKNELVFALGVALLELSHGQPLHSLHTPDDLNEQGMEDSMTQVSIATRLADRIHEREMENYAKAVLRCIRCNFDTFACDFEDREFREKFFEGLVAPLRADYEFATGGKP